MTLRHTLLGTIILAAAIFAGTWLFLQRMPISQEARERNCVDDQRRVLAIIYLRLKDGVTQEQVEAAILAHCDCFAREVTRRLTLEELAALDGKRRTRSIDAKLVQVSKECRPRDILGD